MTLRSGANLGFIENDSASARKDEWRSLLYFAKKSDYRILASTLINEAIGTGFHDQALTITTDWIANLRPRQDAARTAKEIVALFEKLQPRFRFILSLTPAKRLFIGELLFAETTTCVLSTTGADDVCVITKEPTTSNIYKYNLIYSKTLASSDDFFRFMVYGEEEVDDGQYNIKITKDEVGYAHYAIEKY